MQYFELGAGALNGLTLDMRSLVFINLNESVLEICDL